MKHTEWFLGFDYMAGAAFGYGMGKSSWLYGVCLFVGLCAVNLVIRGAAMLGARIVHAVRAS